MGGSWLSAEKPSGELGSIQIWQDSSAPFSRAGQPPWNQPAGPESCATGPPSLQTPPPESVIGAVTRSLTGDGFITSIFNTLCVSGSWRGGLLGGESLLIEHLLSARHGAISVHISSAGSSDSCVQDRGRWVRSRSSTGFLLCRTCPSL